MALAEAEANELRAEAERFRDQMMTKLREADRVLHVASLLAAGDRAQVALEDALERARQATGAAGEAERAEAEAAKPAQEAYALHHRAAQDEEAARRLGKGPAAEAEALDKLAARATVLARYQAPCRRPQRHGRKLKRSPRRLPPGSRSPRRPVTVRCGSMSVSVMCRCLGRR